MKIAFETNNTNPIVRFYSIYFLTQYSDSFPYLDIAKAHLNDTALIKINEWSLFSEGPSSQGIYSQSLGEIFVDLIGWSQYGEYDYHKSYKAWQYLKRKNIDKSKMDSLLLCKANNLKQTNKLFLSNNKKQGCYTCIRKHTIHNKIAIILLSTYQNENDIKLITKSIENANSKEIRLLFKAFINFQHPKMFRFLKKNINNYYHYKYYLDAVAKYKNKNALKILEQAFEKTNNNVTLNYIKNAIKNNFISDYADLFFKVLEKTLSPFTKIPKELWQIDKERSFNIILNAIEKDSHAKCGHMRRKSLIIRMEKIIIKYAPNMLDRFNKELLKN